MRQSPFALPSRLLQPRIAFCVGQRVLDYNTPLLKAHLPQQSQAQQSPAASYREWGSGSRLLLSGAVGTARCRGCARLLGDKVLHTWPMAQSGRSHCHPGPRGVPPPPAVLAPLPSSWGNGRVWLLDPLWGSTFHIKHHVLQETSVAGYSEVTSVHCASADKISMITEIWI